MNRSSRTRSGCCRRDSLIPTRSSPLPAVQFPHQPFRQHCGNDRFANEESGVKDLGREQQEDISVPINTFLGQNVSKLIPTATDTYFDEGRPQSLHTAPQHYPAKTRATESRTSSRLAEALLSLQGFCPADRCRPSLSPHLRFSHCFCSL